MSERRSFLEVDLASVTGDHARLEEIRGEPEWDEHLAALENPSPLPSWARRMVHEDRDARSHRRWWLNAVGLSFAALGSIWLLVGNQEGKTPEPATLVNVTIETSGGTVRRLRPGELLSELPAMRIELGEERSAWWALDLALPDGQRQRLSAGRFVDTVTSPSRTAPPESKVILVLADQPIGERPPRSATEHVLLTVAAADPPVREDEPLAPEPVDGVVPERTGPWPLGDAEDLPSALDWVEQEDFWAAGDRTSYRTYEGQLYDAAGVRFIEPDSFVMITGEIDTPPEVVANALFERAGDLTRFASVVEAVATLGEGYDGDRDLEYRDLFVVVDFRLFYGYASLRVRRVWDADLGRYVVWFEKLPWSALESGTALTYLQKANATKGRVDRRWLFNSFTEISDVSGGAFVEPVSHGESRLTLFARLRFDEGSEFVARAGTQMPSVLKSLAKVTFDGWAALGDPGSSP